VKGIYSVEITDAIGQKLILSTPINEPEIIEQIVVVEKTPRGTKPPPNSSNSTSGKKKKGKK
jgi:hypothetical protein